MKRLKVVAGILLDEDRVLVSERIGDPAFAGFWEFPGGKIQPGEAVLEALCRELREELGIEMPRCVPFMSLQHDYPDRHVDIRFYCVTSWQNEPAGREGQRLQWIERSELAAVRLLPADRPVVEKLMLGARSD